MVKLLFMDTNILRKKYQNKNTFLNAPITVFIMPNYFDNIAIILTL